MYLKNHPLPLLVLFLLPLFGCSFHEDEKILYLLEYQGQTISPEDSKYSWVANTRDGILQLYQLIPEDERPSYIILMEFKDTGEAIPELIDVYHGPLDGSFVRKLDAGVVELQLWDPEGVISGRVTVRTSIFSPAVELFWIDLSNDVNVGEGDWIEIIAG